MVAKHKHYEAIVGWAEGKPIQFLDGTRWADIDGDPSWYDDYEYRVKPIEYPKSNLSYGDLCNIVNKVIKEQDLSGSHEGFQTLLARRAADEALKAFLKDEVAVMAWLKQSGMVVEGSN